MSKRYTQSAAVLEWLKAGKPLTRLEGFRSLGVADLPKTIGKLRKGGTVILTEMIGHKSRYGKTRHALYKFIKDAPKVETTEGEHDDAK